MRGVFFLGLLLVACGSSSNGSSTGGQNAGGSSAGGSTSTGGTAVGGGGAAAGGAGGATSGPSLTLSLDSTIDADDGTSKATSITAALLLDKTGATVGTATISGGNAVFSLSGVSAGDFFIEVNGDTADLVPTRIDDPTKDLEQRVGNKLRNSYIGPAATPVYRINTYSAGQSYNPVVQFSDGTAITGEQAYVILTLATPKVEVNVLGTAAPLTSITPTATHMSGNQPFDSWLFMTTGMDHHGDMSQGAGGMAGMSMCTTCHTNATTKPAAHSDITPQNGWCYQCHNGPTGPTSGFVDPAH